MASKQTDNFKNVNASQEGADQQQATKQREPWSAKSRVLAGFAVALSVVALVAGVRLTVAAFSANDYLKAVAATSEAANLLSSDQLTAFTTDSPSDDLIPNKSLVVGQGDATTGLTSFQFSIFNYLQNDPTIWCQRNITYNLTVTVEGSSAPTSCRLNTVAFSESGIASLSNQSLAGRQKSTNTYTIQLPKEDINKTTFKVRVTVTDAGGTMIRSMAANIMPSLKAEVKPISWRIESAEKTDANKPNDFDAYNYDITVEGGKTKVTFTWDETKVQLDPFFAQKPVGTDSSGNQVYPTVIGNQATFEMDPGTLRVNFYRLDGKIDASTDWDALGVKRVD